MRKAFLYHRDHFLGVVLTFFFVLSFQINSYSQDSFLEKAAEKGKQLAQKRQRTKDKEEDKDKSTLLKAADKLNKLEKVNIKKEKGKEEKIKSVKIGNVEVSR